MALIEIRDKEGNRLAAADDLSQAIAQLVETCSDYRSTVARLQAAIIQSGVIEPDVSATAPEHVAVYSAGWTAAIRAVRNVHSDT